MVPGALQFERVSAAHVSGERGHVPGQQLADAALVTLGPWVHVADVPVQRFAVVEQAAAQLVSVRPVRVPGPGCSVVGLMCRTVFEGQEPFAAVGFLARQVLVFAVVPTHVQPQSCVVAKIPIALLARRTDRRCGWRPAAFRRGHKMIGHWHRQRFQKVRLQWVTGVITRQFLNINRLHRN